MWPYFYKRISNQKKELQKPVRSTNGQIQSMKYRKLPRGISTHCGKKTYKKTIFSQVRGNIKPLNLCTVENNLRKKNSSKRMTYRQFHLLILFFYIKRPPSFHSFLLKNIYHWHRTVLQHGKSAQFARFCTTWKAVQIQSNGTYEGTKVSR